MPQVGACTSSKESADTNVHHWSCGRADGCASSVVAHLAIGAAVWSADKVANIMYTTATAALDVAAATTRAKHWARV